jgi:hypothetical protein
MDASVIREFSEFLRYASVIRGTFRVRTLRQCD